MFLPEKEIERISKIKIMGSFLFNVLLKPKE
jgi:hypothetical protein